MLRPSKWFGLAVVTGLLLVSTACLEGFERLETRVAYDPYAQTFAVERRLVGVAPSFLGCADVDGCVDVIGRSLSLEAGGTTALADRLLQRLVESGAQDVRITLEKVGERLDVLVTYTAPVGSGAADDTMVRAEWDGKNERGKYYLVVTAQDAMEPPRKHRVRKVARGGAGGTEWVAEWVLPTRDLEVETTLPIGAADPLFERVPGLADALAARGWLDGSPSVPVPVPVPVAAPVPVPAPEPVAVVAPAPAPVLTPVAKVVPAPAPPPPPAVIAPAPAPPPASLPPDPSSPARTWVYDVQVSGGGLSPAVATQTTVPLVPRIERCYQDRHAADSSVAGSVFLDAQVRGDGSIVSTSVYGQLADRPLLACLEGVMELWTFPAWGSPEAVCGVALPLVFRVEAPPPTKKKKK